MTPRWLAAAVLALTLTACGGSPAAPTNTLNLAGTWTGTWQYLTAGVTVTDSVTATLTQTGGTTFGAWTAASAASGQFNFAPASSITGSFTIGQTLLRFETCVATTTLSGTASATTLDFAIATPAAAGLCQWATNQQFSLRKQ